MKSILQNLGKKGLHYLIQISVSFLLIGTLATTSLAQTEEAVSIPAWVLDNVVDELTQLDGLRYELNLKDSLLHIYADENGKLKEQVRIHKLTSEEYKAIIIANKDLLAIEEAKNRDLKKQVRKANIRSILITAGAVALVILLL